MMMQRGVAILSALVATATCSCRRSSRDEPAAPVAAAKPVTKPSPAPRTDVAAPPAPTPSIPARIFIDTSGSMAGFFSSRPPEAAGSRIKAVHGEIDTAVSESGLGTARKCTVGDDVTCDRPEIKLADRAIYHEKTSRLDKVLMRAPVPSRTDPNAPPRPDLLDDARVTLLITDGMEVASGGTGRSSCAAGADPTCIRMLLEQRIAEGFAVSLVGLLLAFDGVHYPEQALTMEYLQRARNHINELRLDRRNLGVAFEVGGQLGLDRSTGKSTFSYRGYKALLVFVFSRDPALARRLTDALVARLRAAPLQPGRMRPEDTVQRVELAPLAAAAVRATAVDLVPAQDQKKLLGEDRFDPAHLAEFKLGEHAAFGAGLSQRLWCGGNGGSLLHVRYEQAARSLPAYLHEQVALVAAAGAPPGAITPPRTLDAGRILTGVTCAPIRASPDTELGFALQTRVVLDEPALRDQWWSSSQWSSDNTSEMPERVYGLESLVRPILLDRAAKSTQWGRVVLHVKRD